MKILLNLCLFLSILKGGEAELADHPYVGMSRLLKAAIANQEDMNDALADLQTKKNNKIQSTPGVTRKAKDQQLKNCAQFCESVLKTSNANIEAFKKIMSLIKSIDSEKQYKELLSTLLESRLDNLYKRKKGLKDGVFYPTTDPHYVFSGGCKIENAYNRAISRGTASFYKIGTELCLETLKIMPKTALDPTNLALLQASPSLCAILKGGKITHSDDVIGFDGTNFFNRPDRDGDDDLYNHHFGKWKYSVTKRDVLIPFDNDIIDSLDLTPSGKKRLLEVKKHTSLGMSASQRKYAQGFETQWPLFTTLRYIDAEIPAMHRRNPARGPMIQQRFELMQVAAAHPLPSLDGVDWVSPYPFISYHELMRLLHPPKVVVEVVKEKRRKRIVESDLTVEELPEVVVAEAVMHDDLPRDEFLVENLEQVVVAAAAFVPVAAAVPQSRDKESDVFEYLIGLLRGTKILHFRHFRNAWEAIGTLQSPGKGGSHLSMLYNGKRVGCAVKLHEGEEGYGPRSRKYFLEEVVNLIIPDRLRGLLA